MHWCEMYFVKSSYQIKCYPNPNKSNLAKGLAVW